jgi:surface protein
VAKIYVKSKNIKYAISGERIFIREKDRCKNKQIKALNYGSTKKFNLIFSIILLFFLIKLTTITSFLLNLNNKKRSLIVFISSIKLKIDVSGENIIFFGDSFKWCTPFKTPDEIYINGENQTEIKNKYSFDNSNNEIILNWYNPLETTNCMFRDCNKITEIDLSNFDDSNLLTMHYMFHGCSSIRSINMSHLKTPKLTDMGSLFRLCTSLKSINIENLNSAGVGPFHYIFQNCYALESINFPNINTLKANAITNNFDNCNNLKYLNLENAKIKTQDKSIFSIIKSNFIICTHSP